MNNLPVVKAGIVAVSRDCFPESLSVNRRKALAEAYERKYDGANIYECPVCIVESEIHMVQALEDVKAAGCTMSGSIYDVINNLSGHIEKQLKEREAACTTE